MGLGAGCRTAGRRVRLLCAASSHCGHAGCSCRALAVLLVQELCKSARALLDSKQLARASMQEGCKRAARARAKVVAFPPEMKAGSWPTGPQAPGWHWVGSWWGGRGGGGVVACMRQVGMRQDSSATAPKSQANPATLSCVGALHAQSTAAKCAVSTTCPARPSVPAQPPSCPCTTPACKSAGLHVCGPHLPDCCPCCASHAELHMLDCCTQGAQQGRGGEHTDVCTAACACRPAPETAWAA